MNSKYVMLLLATMIINSYSLFGQDFYGEWKRKNWSASYLFGLQESSKKDYYGNSHTLSMKRYIGISDIADAHVLADYAYIQGSGAESFHHYAIGAGVSVFPAYIVGMFKKKDVYIQSYHGKEHRTNKDKYFLDLSVRYGINDMDFNLVSSALFHVYTFSLRKHDMLSTPRDGLSPVIGLFLYNRKKDAGPILEDGSSVNSLMFYTLGLSYHF
ncbi:hypothetical protein [Olivibacter sitiensis]|uniref:hypothetical protein n=1 Tax=Olivibacter sitiensis TaxID=376470 RepID=UPI0004853468|nr:hypothetical protein [Olivibacter sitiensis]